MAAEPLGTLGNMKLPPFSVGYVKGQARAATLLALLAACFEKDIELNKVHPILYNSILKIHCMSLMFNTVQERLFHTFKVSVRGSIRRAPNTVTWVQSLLVLRGHGVADASSILRKWNSEASKSSQVVGSKSTGVKHLIDNTPRNVLNIIIQHVSEFGWDDCIFTNDAFSSKKHLPGYVFRSVASKAWSDRGRVTTDSMTVTPSGPPCLRSYIKHL